MQNNIAILTQSHKVIAAKRKARRDQVKQVIFDEQARRDFLTGFHKRKLAKADAARKRAVERERQDRQELRREQRRLLRERAIDNAAKVESAYHAVSSNTDDEDDEWTGISLEEKGKQKEEDYEDDEFLATVTVVEDFDPDSFIHGPRITNDPATCYIIPTKTESETIPKKPSSKKLTARKVRYETKEGRKVERAKQRARRTEKAELAGGKAPRNKGFTPKRKASLKR